MNFRRKRNCAGILIAVIIAVCTVPVSATANGNADGQIRENALDDPQDADDLSNNFSAQFKAYIIDGILPDMDAEMKKINSEIYFPCVTDAFTMTKTLKGIQGNAGFEHYFMNCFLDTGFATAEDRKAAAYDYEGKTYYFCVPDGINELLIRSCNKDKKTVSIKFLLRYAEGKERMIDPAARSGGYKYYAPNFTEEEVAKEYEAFFHFLAEKFSRANCHIDNWILANEENMPAMGRYHPYSTYYGTLDKHTIVSKYADYFMCVYGAVRDYTTATRVSISVDHSWQSSDDGRGISTKDFLDEFCEIVGTEPLWYIDYHAYPAVIYDTRIWARYSPLTGTKLNPKQESARFVDGANLYIVTDYVKEHYGRQHRLMLTEVGFSQYAGVDEQAASFAYTYYAAKYSKMVDCLILHTYNQGGKMDFSFNLPIDRVFHKIDSGNPTDQVFIDSFCLPVIGAESWAEIVPGYPQ